MPKLTLLTKTADGVLVFYDATNSHAATHFSDTPALKQLAIEILQTKKLTEDREWFETDFGKIIGQTDEVENEPGDVIVYAKRKNRDIYTSFNKTKSSQPCTKVSLALNRTSDGSYELVSCWIGHFNSPPFPGDENEQPQSKEYWTRHSLVWGSQAVQPGTETTECPW